MLIVSYFQVRRQVESSGDEDSDSGASDAPRRSKAASKRKAASGPSGPAKKQKQKTSGKEEVQSAEEDPVRKYCMGKLKGILSNIFQTQRPYVKPDGPEEDDEAEEEHRRKNEVKAKIRVK